MLPCPFLHANLSFLFIYFSFVMLFEASSPSCFESPFLRHAFTDLHLAVACVCQLSPLHVDLWKTWSSLIPSWWPPPLMLPRRIGCQCVSCLGPSMFPVVTKCLIFLTWIISVMQLWPQCCVWMSFANCCCPGWEGSARGWWELLKLALLLLEIHFAITFSENPT